MGKASQLHASQLHQGATGDVVASLDRASMSDTKPDATRSPNPPESITPSTGTLGKAMDLLSIIAFARRPMRFTDILKQCDQPRGTLHRQLSNLVEEGLLTVNADHTYALGLRLLQLANKAWAGNEFRQIAEPHIRELQELTGETVHLGILKQQSVIYLDKVESRQSVRMHSMIGNTSPIYCTGVGKAALSLHDDAWISEQFANVEFQRFTDTTLPDLAALISEIHEIRRDGIAWDREEHEAGIHCVAAPVSGASQGIFAGISVTAPVYRVSCDKLGSWADLVKRTAKNITQDVHAKLAPRS